MYRGGEPQRITPGHNVELLDEDQRASYNSWYKSMPKNEREEIPGQVLSQQLNFHEPYYKFDDTETIFATRDENNNFIAGGTVLGCTLENGKRIGELAGVYVTTTERKKGIGQQIDQKRQDWCAGKFEWLQTHIASANIPSLRLKLKQGFTIKNVTAGFNEKNKKGVGSCLLTNQTTADQVDQPRFATSIISLTDLNALQQHTRNRWEGIDLQPIADEENLDPANWLITLRKKI